MVETWLRTNRRALLFGMILPGLGVVAGWALLMVDFPLVGAWSDAVGWILIGVCLLTVAALAAQWFQPRIGYKPGFLVVSLGNGGGPTELPLHVVECFLLGQGEGTIPVAGGKQIRASNLIMKLADKETEWAHRDVKPALGTWCGGYVTIKGAWCEPLDVDVVKRLNRTLAEANRNHGKKAQSG